MLVHFRNTLSTKSFLRLLKNVRPRERFIIPCSSLRSLSQIQSFPMVDLPQEKEPPKPANGSIGEELITSCSESDYYKRKEKGIPTIDKTKEITNISYREKFVLICRPKRFGKTLSLSTRKYMYTGTATICLYIIDPEMEIKGTDIKLFKDTWLEENLDRVTAKGRPIRSIIDAPRVVLDFKMPVCATRYSKAVVPEKTQEKLSKKYETIEEIRLKNPSYEIDMPIIDDETIKDLEKLQVFNDLVVVFKDMLIHVGKENKIKNFVYDDVAMVFTNLKNLLWCAYQKKKKTIIINVDEYDQIITSAIAKGFSPAQIQVITSFMHDFFLQFKLYEHYLESCWFTGVSKYSKAALFSGFNNVIDYSEYERTADLHGFTLEDLNSPEIKPLLQNIVDNQIEHNKNITVTELIDQIMFHYDGFRFAPAMKAPTVVNPCSLMRFLDFNCNSTEPLDTTLSTHLAKTIQYYPLELFKIFKDEYLLNKEALTTPLIPWIKPTKKEHLLLLYQQGLLTIKGKKGNIIHLGFPNQEMQCVFYDELFKLKNSSLSLTDLGNLLKVGDLTKFLEILVQYITPEQAGWNENNNEFYYHCTIASSLRHCASNNLTKVWNEIKIGGKIPDTILYHKENSTTYFNIIEYSYQKDGLKNDTEKKFAEGCKAQKRDPRLPKTSAEKFMSLRRAYPIKIEQLIDKHAADAETVIIRLIALDFNLSRLERGLIFETQLEHKKIMKKFEEYDLIVSYPKDIDIPQEMVDPDQDKRNLDIPQEMVDSDQDDIPQEMVDPDQDDIPQEMVHPDQDKSNQ